MSIQRLRGPKLSPAHTASKPKRHWGTPNAHEKKKKKAYEGIFSTHCNDCIMLNNYKVRALVDAERINK